MLYKTTNKETLKRVEERFDADEIIIVNSNLKALFEFKKDDHLIALFPFIDIDSEELFSKALHELFIRENTVCTLNNYPVPVNFCLMNGLERFSYAINAKEIGHSNFEILAMRKAIGLRFYADLFVR